MGVALCSPHQPTICSPAPHSPTNQPTDHPTNQTNRHDAPIVVKAFLTHDLATLKKHIGPELEERMGGMFKFFEAAVSFDVLLLYDSNAHFKNLR